MRYFLHVQHETKRFFYSLGSTSDLIEAQTYSQITVKVTPNSSASLADKIHHSALCNCHKLTRLSANQHRYLHRPNRMSLLLEHFNIYRLFLFLTLTFVLNSALIASIGDFSNKKPCIHTEKKQPLGHLYIFSYFLKVRNTQLFFKLVHFLKDLIIPSYKIYWNIQLFCKVFNLTLVISYTGT